MSDDCAAREASKQATLERGRSPSASEVDEIEARLRGPVNCWLNNAQQTDFARLVQLARYGEAKRIEARSIPVEPYPTLKEPPYSRDAPG